MGDNRMRPKTQVAPGLDGIKRVTIGRRPDWERECIARFGGGCRGIEGKVDG